jgi:hypothetical protein
VVRVCRACGRHVTGESTSLVGRHRFPRDIILWPSATTTLG